MRGTPTLPAPPAPGTDAAPRKLTIRQRKNAGTRAVRLRGVDICTGASGVSGVSAWIKGLRRPSLTPVFENWGEKRKGFPLVLA